MKMINVLNREFSLLLVAFCMILLTPLLCFSAPAINSVTGAVQHGGQVTLSGSGFGTKVPAAPVVWDDCSGNDIRNLWDGAWPDNSSNATNDTKYRTPIRGLSLPHSNITKYIAGSHAENNDYNAGYNVMFWKNRTVSSYPKYTYTSLYMRLDPAWNFAGRNNLKLFDWSRGTSPYDMPPNWYIEEYQTSSPGPISWHLNDDDSALGWTYNDWYGSNGMDAWTYWTKVEVEIKWTTDSTGYIKVWDMRSGQTVKQVFNLTGDNTDSAAWGTSRSWGIGGYASPSGVSSKWRYFADIYLDYTPSRIVMGDASTYTKCTIREAQIPAAWSNGSITFTVNQGVLQQDQTAYLFVVDANGNVNSNGYTITIGGGSSNNIPNTPTGLHVDTE